MVEVVPYHPKTKQPISVHVYDFDAPGMIFRIFRPPNFRGLNANKLYQ